MYFHNNGAEKHFEKCENERLLWKSFCRGEQEALNDLFRIYYIPLYEYGIKIIDSDETVKDAIQKLFFKLWKKKGSLSVPASVKGYLLVSFRRILLRIKEKRQNQYRRNKEYIDNAVNISFSKEDIIIRDEIVREQKEELLEGINSLTDRQKETLFLRYYHGLTNKEISDVIGINQQSVKNNLYRALKRLKKVVKLVPGVNKGHR